MTVKYQTLRCSTLYSVVAVLFYTLLVQSAQAQDVLAENQDLVPLKTVGVLGRPRPEYDPIGISLGAFRLLPELSVGESYDNNIFATDTDVVADELTTTSGSFTLQYLGRSPSLSLTGGVMSQNYAHNHTEDYVDWNGGASAAYDFGHWASTSLDGTYVRSHLAREDPSFPVDAIEPPALDTRAGNLDIKHFMPRGNIDLNTQLHSFEFYDARLPNDVSVSQSFKNRDELILDLRGNFLVGPHTSAFLDVNHKEESYTERAVASGLDRDSTTNTVGLGTSFEITNLMRGELGAGVLRLHNAELAQGTQTTYTFRANIEMYLTQILTARLTAERATGPADILVSSSYVGTSVTPAIDYELRRNIILSASLSYSHRVYTGINESETTSGGGVRANWLLNRYLKVDLAYTLSHRTSPLQTYLGQNYSERIVEADLNLRL